MAKRKDSISHFKVRSVTYIDDPAAASRWTEVYLDIIKEKAFKLYSKQASEQHMDDVFGGDDYFDGIS